MSYPPQQPPPPPAGWPPPPAQPPAPKKKSPAWLVALVIGLVALLCLVGIVAAVGGVDTDTSNGGATVDTPGGEPTTAGADYPDPDPEDFSLKVKVLKKQCFGSAGCNVTYRVEVGYDGPELDPDVTYELTYEVRGVEDGPAVNTLELTGDAYETDKEEHASTSSTSTKLKAVVTDISEI